MIILGIDGSLTCTGVAVIEYLNGKCSPVMATTICTAPTDEIDDRLAKIARSIKGIIDQYLPDACAIEAQFQGTHGNGQAENKVSQAWGAIVAAVALSGLSVARYAPSSVKLAVAGCGHASKEAVAVAVNQILKPESPITQMDESDACAVAITHALRSCRRSSSHLAETPEAANAMNERRSSKRPLPAAIQRAIGRVQ